ncbi:MAG: hypothetical protein ABI151_00940, partial [Chitinophagaceae bacterium]
MYKQLFLLLFLAAFMLYGCKSSPATVLPEAGAKALPFTSMVLNNLDAFEPVQPDEWQVAGGIYMSRTDGTKVETGDGAGILCGSMIGSKSTKIATTFRHGDLDLTLDFMVSKGAVASIWLQGRYKISIKDSWNRENVTAE